MLFSKDSLKALLSKGLVLKQELLPPSFSLQLETYIKNPKEYYFQKLLNLKKEKISAGSADHKTIGLIFHETIEALYKPFVGKYLEKNDLKDALLNINKTLKHTFSVKNSVSV